MKEKVVLGLMTDELNIAILNSFEQPSKHLLKKADTNILSW